MNSTRNPYYSEDHPFLFVSKARSLVQKLTFNDAAYYLELSTGFKNWAKKELLRMEEAVYPYGRNLLAAENYIQEEDEPNIVADTPEMIARYQEDNKEKRIVGVIVPNLWGRDPLDCNCI